MDAASARALAERHISMVRASVARDEWVMEMWGILKSLMEDEKHNRNVFNEPVDDKLVIGYYNVIRNPMDFGTIKGRLEDGIYPSVEAFVKDVQLVFANAVVFNLPEHFVHKAAKQLKRIFEEKLAAAQKRIQAEVEKRQNHSCATCDGKKCAVCTKGCLDYALPDIRCSPPCKARIPRNATYYRLGGDRGQHWCLRCYSSLKDEFIGLLGQLVRKKDLEQCCNNEVYREPWIRCARCSRWSHMICTLYLEAFNKPSDPLHSVPANRDPGPESFVCVLCLSESNGTPTSKSPGNKTAQLSKLALPPPLSLPRTDLIPTTPMSDYLEKRIREAAILEMTSKPATPGHALVHPKMSRAEAERIASTLKVRVVSHVKSDGGLEARIRKWVETQSFVANRLPGEALTRFPHRAKTICIFQENSPMETMLCFALYVQEYGQECPVHSANRGAVYVSYLDSVPYIRPRRLRTVAYQEIMVGYFQWVRQRGFHRCYIWACPPQKGDAYVMNCHPPWQRNPSAERLRKWYSTIFKRCRMENMVEADTTMFDLHLAQFKPIVHTRRSVANASSGGSSSHDNLSPGSDGEKQIRRHTGPFHLEQLPYFTGDFIYTELEMVLAQLEQVDSDLTETKIREWWLNVWGPNATVEVVKEEGARDDGLLFDEAGLPYPSTLIYVKPSIPPPPMETLMRLERECCSVSDRDEWIMRKVSGAVRPQKDNFFVLVFNKPEQSTTTPTVDVAHANKKSKMSSESGVEMANLTKVVPPSTLASDLSDPDPLFPRTCFDSRLAFLDLCIVNHLQFSSFRHAKFATSVVLQFLQHSFGASVTQG